MLRILSGSQPWSGSGPSVQIWVRFGGDDMDDEQEQELTEAQREILRRLEAGEHVELSPDSLTAVMGEVM